MFKTMKKKFDVDKETLAISAAMLSVPVSILALASSIRTCLK